MSRALRLVKQEFGSEAVILSARSLKRESGVLGFLAKPGVEVTAATDATCPQNKNTLSIGSRGNQTEHLPLEYRMNDPNSRKRGFINSIHGGVKALKDRYKPPVKEMCVPQNIPEELMMLRQRLLSQGVEEVIALELIETMNKKLLSKETLGKEEVKSCFVRTIEEMGITTGSKGNGNGRQKIVAFVGPTGVGKTTTVAKLAALQTFEMKKRVALITLDNHRIGGIEQLKIFARIIGIPIIVVSDSKELKKALKKLKNKDIVLLDTAGVSQKDIDRFHELKNVFDRMRHIEIQLLLDATKKQKDLFALLEKFKAIPISALIFTKLDETTSYGNMFNLLIRRRIPISYFSNGQQVPGDIERASLESFAEMIMSDEKGKVTVSGVPQKESDLKESNRKPEQNFIKGEEHKSREEKHSPEVVDRHSSKFYVANKNSDIFHYPGCKWANKIKSENLIVFECVLDAVDKDYKPCRLCKPEGYEEHSNINEVGRIKTAGSYGY